jgi:hypothetical protein
LTDIFPIGGVDFSVVDARAKQSIRRKRSAIRKTGRILQKALATESRLFANAVERVLRRRAVLRRKEGFRGLGIDAKDSEIVKIGVSERRSAARRRTGLVEYGCGLNPRGVLRTALKWDPKGRGDRARTERARRAHNTTHMMRDMEARFLIEINNHYLEGLCDCSDRR